MLSSETRSAGSHQPNGNQPPRGGWSRIRAYARKHRRGLIAGASTVTGCVSFVLSHDSSTAVTLAASAGAVVDFLTKEDGRSQS
jgi:hypothetical protein